MIRSEIRSSNERRNTTRRLLSEAKREASKRARRNGRSREGETKTHLYHYHFRGVEKEKEEKRGGEKALCSTLLALNSTLFKEIALCALKLTLEHSNRHTLFLLEFTP